MRKELLGALSALALMTGAAVAQTDTPKTMTTTPNAPAAESGGMMNNQGMDPKMQSGMDRNMQESSTGATVTSASAEGMMGKDVYGSDGSELGEVDDVIIDPQSGQAKQLVISSGGFLGIGEKKIAIDMQNAKMTTEGNDTRLTVQNMTQADVENMPEFEYNESMTSLNRQGDNATGSSKAQ
jgi:sporulation protein YlmC with PRC-barrel domain